MSFSKDLALANSSHDGLLTARYVSFPICRSLQGPATLSCRMQKLSKRREDVRQAPSA